jgi:hypothetical protein
VDNLERGLIGDAIPGVNEDQAKDRTNKDIPGLAGI